MILLRTKLRYLYHFSRPSLSSLTSFKDLQAVLQRRLIHNIKQVNASRLKHNNFIDDTAHLLKLSPAAAQEVAQRTLPLTLVNARTQLAQNLQVKIHQNLTRLPLDPREVGFPFAEPRALLKHFSEDRGVAKFDELKEYDWDNRTIRIFNLPDNVNEQDIIVILKTTEVKVTFKYCVLGLPAFAKVEFGDQGELLKCLERIPTKHIQFGDRVAHIRTKQDSQKLQLGNRRLSITLPQDKTFQETLITLSKYGRVMHLDWPLQIWMNPTLQQVKQHYKNSSELLKINQIHSDGTVQSEYYPACNAWDHWEDQRDEINIIERAEKLKDSYENRTRFARPLNIYVGKEHQLIARNKGYCVVTYSTYEEGQSYYFSQAAYEQIQLVGDKEEFELDPSYRRELLRQIDNEYLLGKKNRWQQQQDNPTHKVGEFKDTRDAYEKGYAYDAEESDPTEQKENIVYGIMMKMYTQAGLTKTPGQIYGHGLINYLLQDNEFIEWQNHLHRMRTVKSRSNKQTFDELAEIELYGRVLPKSSKVEKIHVEDATYVDNTKNVLIQENNLLHNSRDIYNRNKEYDRLRERNNRRADEAAGIVHAVPGEEQIPEVEGEVEVAAETDGAIGKAAFSTFKPASLYRKRTADQQAQYYRRLFHFTRNTIYEYMGIFQDKLIEEVIDHRAQILNPLSLKWPDGSPYLTEPELTNILQFRRDFQSAQDDYENYILGSEFIKSAGINTDKLRANFQQHESAALQHLTDIGVVEEVKKVTGNDLEKKVSILNAQSADFGEEYRLQRHGENEGHLVKMRKLEHLLPLDRVEHLEKFISQHGSDITDQQSKIFEQYHASMKENDAIPDAVSDAFGVPRGKRVSDLLAEVGATYNISRKDLEMAERAKTYTPQELEKDMESQMKLERLRQRRRKVSSNSFAKDPSEIYVQDREGYYRVSRFRQI